MATTKMFKDHSNKYCCVQQKTTQENETIHNALPIILSHHFMKRKNILLIKRRSISLDLQTRQIQMHFHHSCNFSLTTYQYTFPYCFHSKLLRIVFQLLFPYLFIQCRFTCKFLFIWSHVHIGPKSASRNFDIFIRHLRNKSNIQFPDAFIVNIISICLKF